MHFTKVLLYYICAAQTQQFVGQHKYMNQKFI